MVMEHCVKLLCGFIATPQLSFLAFPHALFNRTLFTQAAFIFHGNTHTRTSITWESTVKFSASLGCPTNGTTVLHEQSFWCTFTQWTFKHDVWQTSSVFLHQVSSRAAMTWLKFYVICCVISCHELWRYVMTWGSYLKFKSITAWEES